MRCACIDGGSNTTRLLVAERGTGGVVLRTVVSDRSFTRLSAGRAADGSIMSERIGAVAAVVAAQAAQAQVAGVDALRVVATAAVRDAPNGAELCAQVRERAHVDIEVLSAEEEGRLAFAGAINTLGGAGDAHGDARVAVVDVGGGSTELVCGTPTTGVRWMRSFAIGSGMLTERHIDGDRPTTTELAALRTEVRACFAALDPPTLDAAYAVGGSATSLGRLTRGALHPASLARALDTLCSGPVIVVADRLGLHADRVRMLPAGIVVLSEAARVLRAPLGIASGGLREGLILSMLPR